MANVVPECHRSFEAPTGNRDALRKRAHYRSYAADSYNFIHTRGAHLLVRATVVSLAFAFSRWVPSEPAGTDPRRLPLFHLHFGPRRTEARDRELGRRAVLSPAIVTSEKSRREQKAWII